MTPLLYKLFSESLRFRLRIVKELPTAATWSAGSRWAAQMAEAFCLPVSTLKTHLGHRAQAQKAGQAHVARLRIHHHQGFLGKRQP